MAQEQECLARHAAGRRVVWVIKHWNGIPQVRPLEKTKAHPVRICWVGKVASARQEIPNGARFLPD